jgi:DNA-binding Lrp family transcriptional regulator
MSDSSLNKYELDSVDLGIINRLKIDPRETTRSLAQHLSVSESTIGSRLQAMENANVMKVVAQRDFRAAGYEVLANVVINVAGRALDEGANDLAKIDEVGSLTLFIGDPSIMLLAMADTLSNLNDLVTERIAKVLGVRSVETMVIANILKYESEFVNITDIDKLQ